MYQYQELRPHVFTENGVRDLLVLRDHVRKCLVLSGAVTLAKALAPICGDSWQQMALVDYLVEIRELIEIPTNARGQDRIFVSAKG